MKKTHIPLFLLLVFTSIQVFARDKKVRFSASEPDAKIWVEGKMQGTGQVEVTVPAYACVTIIVEKTGFLKGSIEFCNKPGFTEPPKIYQYKMEKDDAYESSEATDVANVDIELKVRKSEDEAWRLLTQIITSYVDAIEITDKQTGYLRTAWVVKTFKQATIRTRLIVKSGNSSPLSYKVKLVSEIAEAPNASVKNDEQFKEWDRVLRKYKPIFSELESRIGN